MRARNYRETLTKLIGEHGELAYEGILAIAEGRTTIRKLARDPGPHEDRESVALIPTIEVQPKIRERLAAWIFLAESLNGKPRVEVDVKHRNAGVESIKVERLSDGDLGQLETLLRLAAENRISPTVEAEIVDALPGEPCGER